MGVAAAGDTRARRAACGSRRRSRSPPRTWCPATSSRRPSRATRKTTARSWIPTWRSARRSRSPNTTATAMWARRPRFSDLTFAELPELARMNSDAQGVNLSLRRAGDLVILEGRADLTSLNDPDADVELSVAFPGSVTSTNGDRVDEQTVQWKLKPGVVSMLSAQARYTDPSTRSFQGAALWLALRRSRWPVPSAGWPGTPATGHRRSPNRATRRPADRRPLRSSATSNPASRRTSRTPARNCRRWPPDGCSADSPGRRRRRSPACTDRGSACAVAPVRCSPAS